MFFCLGASAVLLLIVNTIALTSKRGVGMATLGSFVFIIPCMLAPVVALNALCVALAGEVCWISRARARWFVASSFGATVFAYIGFSSIFIWPELREYEQLRKEYPLESLEKRLAYEDRPRTESVVLLPSSLDRLAPLETEVEGTVRLDVRNQSLAWLHAGVVQQFIDSPGFGVGRHVGVRGFPFRLGKDRQEEIEASKQVIFPQPGSAYSSLALASAPLKPDLSHDLQTTHKENALNFINAYGFGYVQSRDRVAGFLPHQFRQAPRAPERWHIERLDLVGLLKYDSPVVYLSSNFPRMDELSTAPTRPLDAFENDALMELRRGEDLMVQEDAKHMRILGSIRALKQCLDCHHAQRGELLGAFSYQMSRDTAEAK